MLKSRIALVAALVLIGAAQSHAQEPIKVKEAKPGLMKQAKVTPADAQKTALSKVSGGTVKSAELEREHGKLVYSFDIKVAGKSGVEEVMVDAQTGALVSREHETPAKEKAEAKA